MTDRYEFVAIGSGAAGESAAELAAWFGRRRGGTLHTMAYMSMATPTYAYAYKYAALDGLRRIAAGKESLDESATRLSPDV